MPIISDAIKEYQKKNYKEAIVLFEKAGEIYMALISLKIIFAGVKQK